MLEIRLMGSHKRIRQFSDEILFPVMIRNNPKGRFESTAIIRLNERQAELLLRQVRRLFCNSRDFRNAV